MSLSQTGEGLPKVAITAAVARKALIRNQPDKECAEGLMQNWLHQQLRALWRRNLGASYSLNNAKQPSSTRCSPEDANHSPPSWSAVKSVSLLSTYRLVRDARGISQKIRTLFTPSLRKERRGCEWATTIIVTVIIRIAKAFNHAHTPSCRAKYILLMVLPALAPKGLVRCATGMGEGGWEDQSPWYNTAYRNKAKESGKPQFFSNQSRPVCLGSREHLCFLFTSLRTYLQIQTVAPKGSRITLLCQYSSSLVLVYLYSPVSIIGKGDERWISLLVRTEIKNKNISL